MRTRIVVLDTDTHSSVIERVNKTVSYAHPEHRLYVSHENGRVFTLVGGLVYNAHGVPLYAVHGSDRNVTEFAVFKRTLTAHVQWLRDKED